MEGFVPTGVYTTMDYETPRTILMHPRAATIVYRFPQPIPEESKPIPQIRNFASQAKVRPSVVELSVLRGERA